MWGCGRNEQKIASASDDWTVGLWDAASPGVVAKLAHHTASVYGVAWSPDGVCIASSSFDRSVVLWDVRTRRIVICVFFSAADCSCKMYLCASLSLPLTSELQAREMKVVNEDDLIGVSFR